jgi:signal transduction histidine kinase/CheY-like chemotaxis protein
MSSVARHSDETMRKAWAQESCEFAIACDTDGRIIWADECARTRVGVSEGMLLFDLGPEGLKERLQSFFSRARDAQTPEIEVPVANAARVDTWAFRGKPDGSGGVLVLGREPPREYRGALRQVEQSLTDVVELNRQILRQSREIERQKNELEKTVRELEESNKGVRTLHAELEDSAEVARRASSMKSRVIANVSHEFRTPLHTILGLSRILLEGTDGVLSDEQRKQIHFVRASAEELSTLVDDMLDISKADAGKAILRPERFTISELMGGLRGMLRPLVTTPENVELRFEEPEETIALDTDRSKLSQILRNLVSNALKFTESGSVTVHAAHENGDLVMRVMDTGIGIPSDQFEHIFEEFGQVENPLQARVKGTGLGLSLSRRLAELLGGTLEVSSTVGSGSTFTLRIPRLHPEVSEFERLQTREIDPSRAPILVVEDDRKTIFVYEKYLALAGFQVVPARSIEDAERIIRKTRPAAVVLDVMLDGETSWNFLARLKKDPETHDIPVLVVTVTAKEEKARALGADEFWIKPVDQARLLRKLGTIVANGSRGKLLVIDDDERARYLMRKHLEGGAYQLFEASSGPEGVHMAQTHRPHVILLDFLLREMNAFDVLDELKGDARTRDIPVIIITSHALEPEERKRLEAVTEVILSKQSLSREIAINRIRDALRKAGVGVGSPQQNHGS